MSEEHQIASPSAATAAAAHDLELANFGLGSGAPEPSTPRSAQLTATGGGAFNNRVHPEPAPSPSQGRSTAHTPKSSRNNSLPPLAPRDPTAPMPMATTMAYPRAKRSSVFSGRPDDIVAASAAPLDEEDAEDGHFAKSAFNRQRSIITLSASSHRMDLFLATFNLCVHVGTILTDLLLLSDYSQNNQNVSAAALAVIRIIVGLVEVEFDYLNRGWKNGRWILIPLIFFNGRILIDYYLYIKDWMKFRNREWANSDFRASVSFETFIGSLPSLIVQAYVIMDDVRPMQQVWTVAFVMTSLSITIDLLHHYAYVRLETSTYVSQFFKALISTGLRTVLVAQLLIIIGRVLMAWMIVSFLIGLGMYYGAVRYSRQQGRDNPFEYGWLVLHGSFGGLIAGTALFVSIPFAPSHSVYDWWLGYLMVEVKMMVENFIMLAVVLNKVHADYRADLFYSLLAFVLICYIGQLCACWFIHQNVRKLLLVRDLYSDTLIIKLFAHYGHYFKTAWYPASIEHHGSAQTHLMYQDNNGDVIEEMEEEHDEAIQRTNSMNMLVRQKSLEVGGSLQVHTQ